MPFICILHMESCTLISRRSLLSLQKTGWQGTKHTLNRCSLPVGQRLQAIVGRFDKAAAVAAPAAFVREIFTLPIPQNLVIGASSKYNREYMKKQSQLGS